MQEPASSSTLGGSQHVEDEVGCSRDGSPSSVSSVIEAKPPLRRTEIEFKEHQAEQRAEKTAGSGVEPTPASPVQGDKYTVGDITVPVSMPVLIVQPEQDAAQAASGPVNGHVAAGGPKGPETSEAKPLELASTLSEWAAGIESSLNDSCSTHPLPTTSAPDPTSAPINGASSSTSIAPELPISPFQKNAEASSSSSVNHAGTSQAASLSSSSIRPTSACNPPYTPPATVRYPVDRTRNPYFGSMMPKPRLDGVLFTNLFRPEYFPADLDPRLNQNSIWMGVDKYTLEAKYFVPASCAQCTSDAKNQHCDRGLPTCRACAKQSLNCTPGFTWRHLKSSKRRVKSSTEAESVGDASSVRAVTDGPATVEAVGSKPDSNVKGEETGRGKRVKKKRRMDDELETIVQLPPSTPKISSTPVQKNRPGPESTYRPNKKPRASVPSGPDKDPPLSESDREYFARVKLNDEKPALRDMRSACPVWAETREALCSAVEYFKNPIRTEGASVAIGQGGTARGVILEGQSPGQWEFWGTGQRAGTIMATMWAMGVALADRSGYSRPVLACENQVNSSNRAHIAVPHVDPSPPPSALCQLVPDGNQDLVKETPSNGSGATSIPQSPNPKESQEIEALLQAMRLRYPIAVAVSQDYSAVPFNVPRKFVVLGWFWVASVSLEPAKIVDDKIISVHRKFQLEWCEPQISPWWSARSDPDRIPTPVLLDEKASMTTGESLHANGSPANPNSDTAEDPDARRCEACGNLNPVVFLDVRLCQNAECPRFYRNGDAIATPTVSRDSPFGAPAVVPAVERIAPDSLNLKLRPDIPNGEEGEARDHAGKNWWRAWVCDDCGMANERRKWEEWDCGACGRHVRPKREICDAFFLRNQSRPLSTGPRQDDGMPSWPFAAEMGWTLFQDDIKVVKHGVGVPGGLGKGSVLLHALNTEGKMSHVAAGMVLRGLQSQGPDEVPFRRRIQPYTTNRPAERYLSPFYTFLLGDPAPDLADFPVAPAVPWTKAPKSCMEAVDLVNERAGRMWPGMKEFNSLLVAAYPPDLPFGSIPTVVVAPNSYFAFLFLGSDGDMRFKQKTSMGKTGQLTYQHGDVIGLKSGDVAIEVSIKPHGFGFVCIGRQVYKDNTLAISNKDTEFPALPQPVSSAVPKAAPRKALATTLTDANSNVPSPAVKVKAKEKPLDKASTKDWYIGARPLDPTDPLRTLPPPEGRQSAQQVRGSEEETEDPKWNGVVLITREDMVYKTVSPVLPPVKDEGGIPAKTKKPRKSKAATAADDTSVISADVDGDISMTGRSPASVRGKKATKRKPRASAASSVLGGEDGSIDETMSVGSGGTGGRGKRKHLAQ